MAEEDAFLDAIAADRADRARLLVFADWLAERDDPREEFIRIHVRLLDMDGTEPEFREQNERWEEWVGGEPFDWPAPARLSERWLDALCRVYTIADSDFYPGTSPDQVVKVNRFEYGPEDFADRGSDAILYHGKPGDFDGPFDFVVKTLAPHWSDVERRDSNIHGSMSNAHLTPLTRGLFWHNWRSVLAWLVNPPPGPVPAADSFFLGAQYIDVDRYFVATVAIHQHDYFALFWSFSD